MFYWSVNTPSMIVSAITDVTNWPQKVTSRNEYFIL